MPFSQQNKRQRIIILGGGFGGLRCALSLAGRLNNNKNIEIILVDKRPHQAIHASLYEVATAKAAKEAICIPLAPALSRKGVVFYHDLVNSIDPVNQTIELHKRGSLAYDYLVIGLGCTANDFGIKGVREFGLPFTTFDDAMAVRLAIKQAMHYKENIRLVIGGAGPTGVELAAAFRSFAGQFCRHNCKHCDHLQVDLIERGPHILAGFPRRLSTIATDTLKQLSVNIYTKAGIISVTKQTITLDNNIKLPYDVFIWTGGVKPNRLLDHELFPHDSHGRVLTNNFLQVKGFSRVYAIGDIAAVNEGKKSIISQTVPYAMAEAAHTARNIARQIAGKSTVAFEPAVYPALIPIGNKTGILTYRHWVISGYLIVRLSWLVQLIYIATVLPFTSACRMVIYGRHTHDVVK